MAGCFASREHQVGTAKRYADAFDRRMNDSIVLRTMQSGLPQSLSPKELALETTPLTRASVPPAIRAWVRYPDGPLQVEGEAVAWTASAVAIRWPAGDVVHKAWVWSSAVERL